MLVGSDHCVRCGGGAGMTSKHPAVAFPAFSVVVICCLLLDHSVMNMVGMPEAEESEERRTISVLGVLLAMVVTVGIGAPVTYAIVVLG